MRNRLIGFLPIGILFCLTFQRVTAELFPLSIIHINDFHARYEPTDTTGGTCDEGEECIGGLGRTVYTVKRLLNELKETNPIYINAGDSFQGTLWYNVGRWNVTSQLLNLLPADAMTLGNHEFDHGIEGLVPFLETIDTQMLVANMDPRDEPSLQGKYKNSTIIVRNNRKIGLIGVILETTYDLANTGKLIFRNESEAILEEAAKLKEQGVNIIVVISHCGYDVDKIIAQQAGSVVDVIVGSHSHTFLYTGTPPGPDTPRGDYPTEVIHASGHRVLIVQAASYAKYVGNITVYFDEDGQIVRHEGAPIYMASNVPQDKRVSKALVFWQDEVKAETNKALGTARKGLSMRKCHKEECALGNLYADALKEAMENVLPEINAALVYHLEIKTSLNKGPINQQDIFNLAPFNDTLIATQLQGQYIRQMLEDSIHSVLLSGNENESKTAFFQISGLKMRIHQNPETSNKEITEILIESGAEKPPKYEPLEDSRKYWLVTSRFVHNGGFGHKYFKDFGQNRIEHSGDFQALMDLISKRQLIENTLDNRITYE